MAIPGQNFTILDPGLAVTPEAIDTPLYVGCCSLAVPLQLYTLSRVSDAVAQLGQGPLAESVCTRLAIAGGPVHAIALEPSVDGAVGPVVPVPGPNGPGSGTMTVAGTPNDGYEGIAEITVGGELGAAEFRYSLDKGFSWSPSLTIPLAGVYAIANTGLTLTFAGAGVPPASGFVTLDRYEFSCTAASYGATELSDAVEAAIATSVEFAYVVLTGTWPDSDAAAVVAAAIASHAQSMFNMYRFVGVLMHSGVDPTTDAIAGFKDFGNTRVGVCYSFAKQISNKPFTGWGVPRRPSVDIIAARAGEVSISTDLGRVATGSLTNIVSIEHDEFRTEVMDQKRFATLRTFQGMPGFYITNGRLMSPLGSDYKYWQHRRCMDVACDTTYKAQVPIINKSVRVNADGTIDDRDARTAESSVQTKLKGALLDPNNAEGTPGHVSALDYKIDRATNVLSTETLKTNVAIRPLGYAKILNTELGFSASAGG